MSLQLRTPGLHFHEVFKELIVEVIGVEEEQQPVSAVVREGDVEELVILVGHSRELRSTAPS